MPATRRKSYDQRSRSNTEAARLLSKAFTERPVFIEDADGDMVRQWTAEQCKTFTQEEIATALRGRRAYERHELLETIPPSAIASCVTRGWLVVDRMRLHHVTEIAAEDLKLPRKGPLGAIKFAGPCGAGWTRRANTKAKPEIGSTIQYLGHDFELRTASVIGAGPVKPDGWHCNDLRLVQATWPSRAPSCTGGGRSYEHRQLPQLRHRGEPGRRPSQAGVRQTLHLVVRNRPGRFTAVFPASNVSSNRYGQAGNMMLYANHGFMTLG